MNSQQFKRYLEATFRTNRTLKFIQKQLYVVESKLKRNLKFSKPKNNEDEQVEYRCKQSKCSFRVTFEKMKSNYGLSSYELNHNHCQTPVELKPLLAQIESKSKSIYQEYFVSRIDNKENKLYFYRPSIILQEMRKNKSFDFEALTCDRKQRVQLKKKFDNVIQVLRRDFQKEYPEITCIEDDFQKLRKIKSQIAQLEDQNEMKIINSEQDSSELTAKIEMEDDQSHSNCENYKNKSIEFDSPQSITQQSDDTLIKLENISTQLYDSQLSYSSESTKVELNDDDKEDFDDNSSESQQSESYECKERLSETSEESIKTYTSQNQQESITFDIYDEDLDFEEEHQLHQNTSLEFFINDQPLNQIDFQTLNSQKNYYTYNNINNYEFDCQINNKISQNLINLISIQKSKQNKFNNQNQFQNKQIAVNNNIKNNTQVKQNQIPLNHPSLQQQQTIEVVPFRYVNWFIKNNSY